MSTIVYTFLCDGIDQSVCEIMITFVERKVRTTQIGSTAPVCMFAGANERRILLVRGVCAVHEMVPKTRKVLVVLKCVMTIVLILEKHVE